MAKFMLLLHENQTNFSEVSAEEIEQIINEYTAWSNALAEKGKMLGGEKLKDDSGKSLVMHGGNLRITDGPFTEAKELIGGFFLIAAENYDEAVKISETCPHLKYGGRIELREVEPTE
jgi:hypothetical protein